MKTKTCIIFLSFFLLTLSPPVIAQIISSHTEPDDAVMSVATISGDDAGRSRPVVIAGYNSGKIICFDTQSNSLPAQLWSTSLEGPVKYILPVPDLNSDGRDNVVVATALGEIAAYNVAGENAGTIIWQYSTPSGIDALCLMPDINDDGIHEIAAGGGDQVLFCLDGATGSPIWTKNLYEVSTFSYIHAIISPGDLNSNGTDDIVVKAWENGHVFAIDSLTGNYIWHKAIDAGFTDALAAMGDITGDGKPDFVTGGNDKVVRLVSGADGNIIWESPLERPIRSVTAVPDVTGDGYPECAAVTAGGEVALIPGNSSGTVHPLWTAQTGDCARKVLSIDDINGDSIPDIIVCSENGVVHAFAGADGSQIHGWQTPDIVRDIHIIGDITSDGYPEIASASLDGTLCYISSVSGEVIEPFFNTEKMSSPDKRTKRAPSGSVRLSRETEPNAEEIPILLYHDIIPICHYHWGITVENFTEQMDYLYEKGFTAVTLDEVADWIEGKITLPYKSVCITFDGPYEGHYTHAKQIMEERGLFAESYITTDWIGTANHCDWHQLRELEITGNQYIQNHSAYHPPFANISSDQVRNQLRWSTQSIESNLNGKLSLHHAYPYGSYNSSVMQILDEEGFRTATTVAGRRAKRTDNLLALPRITIVRTTSINEFIRNIGHVKPYPISEEELPYSFVETVGSNWNMPSYAVIDHEDKLWVCDYSANAVRIFDSNGIEMPFSPITEGLNQNGEAVPCNAPSGIALTPCGDILVSICDYFGSEHYLGLFRYQATDGKPLNGLDLDYKCGEIDCDAEGNIFVVDKTTYKWHIYKPDGTEYPESPFGDQSTNTIQRGISVTPDAGKVYVICETEGIVHVWTGGISEGTAAYTKTDNLISGLHSTSGGVDVMHDGKILVGNDPGHHIYGFHADHTPWGQLSGGTPPLVNPRGTASSDDGKILYVICKSGTPMVQKWQKDEGPTMVEHWKHYTK